MTDTEPEVVLGHRVRQLRAAAGMSQEQLADAMSSRGFSWRQTTVSTTENSARPIRVNELVSLADIFKVPVQELLVQMIGPEEAREHLPQYKAHLAKMDKEAAEVEETIRSIRNSADELQRMEIQALRNLGVLRRQADGLREMIARAEALN